jgi:hypothetical protein
MRGTEWDEDVSTWRAEIKRTICVEAIVGRMAAILAVLAAFVVYNG